MSTAVSSAAAQRAYGVGELWHLCSLDAPVIAALWLRLFSPRISIAATCALAFAVWLLYAADRLIDARKLHSVPGNALEERHHFHALNRRVFVPLMMSTLPLLALSVWQTEAPVRDAWLLLAAPLAAYFLVIHATSLRMPKEMVVGLFFALACSAPALVQHGVEVVAPTAAIFGALCFTNCAAIAAWEARGHQDWVAMHPFTRLLARNITVTCPSIALLSMMLLAYAHIDAVLRACVLSSVALLAVHSARHRFSRLTLRVLADAALLTPILFLPAMH